MALESHSAPRALQPFLYDDAGCEQPVFIYGPEPCEVSAHEHPLLDGTTLGVCEPRPTLRVMGTQSARLQRPVPVDANGVTLGLAYYGNEFWDSALGVRCFPSSRALGKMVCRPGYGAIDPLQRWADAACTVPVFDFDSFPGDCFGFNNEVTFAVEPPADPAVCFPPPAHIYLATGPFPGGPTYRGVAGGACVPAEDEPFPNARIGREIAPSELAELTDRIE